jgi:hypothetical protein
MLNLSFRRLRARFTLLAVVALSALLLRSVAFAQTSVSNGSISGTVTDTTGAVVPNAKAHWANRTSQFRRDSIRRGANRERFAYGLCSHPLVVSISVLGRLVLAL